MPTVVPLQLDEHTKIYVEAAEPTVLPTGSAIQEAASLGDAAARAVATADDLADSIRSFCERIVGGFHAVAEHLRPQRASVEFGLDVSVEGNGQIGCPCSPHRCARCLVPAPSSASWSRSRSLTAVSRRRLS